MPLFLILALFLAAYLVAPIDTATLRATRFAGGAIGAAIGAGRPARSAPRSAGPRTKPGARSKSPRSKGAPIESPRPDRTRSRLGTAIRGGIGAADRAEARRSDLLAAWGEWRARRQQRRHDRQVDQAWRAAIDENDRRDRADRLARISAGTRRLTDQIPEPRPEPVEQPAARTDRPNGDPVPIPDLPQIQTTEMTTLPQLYAELDQVNRIITKLGEAARELDPYLANFSERYAGAGELLKTGQMNAAAALLKEDAAGFSHVPIQLSDIEGRLDGFLNAIRKAMDDVQESDAQTGRVESARAR